MENFYEFADGSKVCNKVFYREIDNFLTPEQCETLKQAAKDVKLEKSHVGEKNSTLDTNIRNSEQAWLKWNHNEVTRYVRNKVMKYISSEEFRDCFPPINHETDLEDIQIVRYGVNGKYDPHYDGTECGKDVGVDCFANQRIATVLMYLNDDFKGGETKFPRFNVDVKPKKGKALFFWVSEPNSRLVYDETLHGGNPVIEGEKWIATQWIRAPMAA